MPIRSPAGSAPKAGDPRAGYVLVEVVATLVITMLLMAFAYPYLPFGTTPTRMLALLDGSVALLRDARTRAIESGTAVPAVFDSGSRSLRVGPDAVVIPRDVTVSFDAGGNCPADSGRAAILFRPDGTNCGGVLKLSKGLQILRARVNWADGRIDALSGQ